MTLPALRASKPGRYLSVVPCPSFGLRPQVELTKGQAKKWPGMFEAVRTSARPVALIDHEGKMVAKSDNWPGE